LIGNTLGGTLSLGVGAYKCLDTHSDNGVYVVEDWEIVDRLNHDGYEQSEYNFDKFVAEIRSMNDGVFGYTSECEGEIA
jgi:hypothetical protein